MKKKLNIFVSIVVIFIIISLFPSVVNARSIESKAFSQYLDEKPDMNLIELIKWFIAMILLGVIFAVLYLLGII